MMNNPANPNGTSNKASGAAYKVILTGTGGPGGIPSTNVKSDVNKNKLTSELAMILQSRQRQDFTREWVRKNIKDYLIEQQEMGKEEHAKMLRELQSKEIYYFNCFFSITENQFTFLVRKLKEKITTYNPQRHKKFFTAEERLSITLKYLATGEFTQILASVDAYVIYGVESVFVLVTKASFDDEIFWTLRANDMTLSSRHFHQVLCFFEPL